MQEASLVNEYNIVAYKLDHAVRSVVRSFVGSGMTLSCFLANYVVDIYKELRAHNEQWHATVF